jgi:VWFA-related protein
MRWFLAVFAIGLSTAQLVSPRANAQSQQGKQEEGSYSLRLQVRQIPVDVVVQDEAGNPVSGLKEEDFAVREDEKPQTIKSFEWFDGAAEFTPPKVPALPANTYVNLPQSEEKGPLYILYYDMVNTDETDQMAFRSELVKFVDHAPEGVRIALFVNARGLHMIQGFTTDRAQLRKAIFDKGPGPHVPDVFIYGGTFGRYDAGAALSNMRFMAQYLEGIPGRKNLIWMASYFPIPVAASLAGSGQIHQAGAAPQLYSVGGQGGPQVLDLSELMREQVRRTWGAMMRSQIALYPLSARGVTGTDHGGEEADAVTDYQLMETIARGTGGHAFAGSNSESHLIEKAIAHGESYYTLTYSPTNTNFDGSERTIQVELRRKGKYKLTYRTIFCALSDDDAAKQKRGDELQERFVLAKEADRLYANIEHGAPMLHDLLFSAHFEKGGSQRMATPEQMQALEDAPDYFRTRRRNSSKPLAPVKLQKYVIRYNVVDPLVRKAIAGNKQSTTLEFAAAVYSDDGRLLNSILNHGLATSNSDSRGGGALLAMQEVEAPQGAAYIRLAVRDTATDRTGTLEVKLPLKDERQVAKK